MLSLSGFPFQIPKAHAAGAKVQEINGVGTNGQSVATFSHFTSGNILVFAGESLTGGVLNTPTDNESGTYTVEQSIKKYCSTCPGTYRLNVYTRTTSPTSHGIAVTQTIGNGTCNCAGIDMYEISGATQTGKTSSSGPWVSPTQYVNVPAFGASGIVLAWIAGTVGNACSIGGNCIPGTGYTAIERSATMTMYGDFYVATNATVKAGNGNWGAMVEGAINLPDSSSSLPVLCTQSDQALGLFAANPTISLSGGSPSPSTVVCNGSSTNVSVTPSTLVTATVPADGSTQRNRFNTGVAGGGTTTTKTSCNGGTCPTWTITIYLECKTLAQANDIDVGPWGPGLSLPIKGTQAGVVTTFTTLMPTVSVLTPVSATVWPDCGVAYTFPSTATDTTNVIWNAQEAVSLIENLGGTTRAIDYSTLGGGIGGFGSCPGCISGITPPNPLGDPLGFLLYLISSNIILFPLLLLFLAIMGYTYIKTRRKAGGR